jgi:hypothetical protein
MLEAAKTLAANTNSAILAKNEAGAVPPAMNTEFKGLVARIYGHAENPGQDFARGRHLPFSAFEGGLGRDEGAQEVARVHDRGTDQCNQVRKTSAGSDLCRQFGSPQTGIQTGGET